jgi:UDP-N-acetylmuramoylalanine--D-glutamate ligase
MHALTLVIGLGQTGQSVARYLKRKGEDFVMFDTRKAPAGLREFQTDFPDISVVLEHYPEDALDHVMRVICSPGVPDSLHVIQAARARAIPIESDMDCLVREVDAPMVVITGTNGKSTVTYLLGEMAKAAGLHVAVAGNIGIPVLDCFASSDAFDVWVLEVSSFQLELTNTLSPRVAAFLNISPDHLDRHEHEQAYLAAKQRVYRRAEVCLFNRDNPETYPDSDNLKQGSRIISYGEDAPASEAWGLRSDAKGSCWLAYGDELILPAKALLIEGGHNALNALAALALAEELGLPRDSSLQALTKFRGLPHRCQRVKELDGVTWINDSKGTNVGATESAIAGLAPSLEGKLVLILGGQGKGGVFEQLRDGVHAHARALVLIGDDAIRIEKALGDLVPVFYAHSMHEAVQCAQLHAKPGDAVLLSPACASFDWFDDFNQRGDVFTACVEAL